MSDALKLRQKALHVRELARALSDAHASAALEALADEFDLQAAELEQQQEQG